MIKNLTYPQFLDQVYKPDAINNSFDRAIIVDRFRSPDAPAKFAVVSFFLDYVSRKYLFVDESCLALLGYHTSYFMAYGLEGYRRKWHATDQKLIDEKVFPDNLSFLETLPVEKYPDYIFSHNYRVQNAAGEYVTLIQRYSFVPGETISRPGGVIGIVFDVTHYKNTRSIVHTIEQRYDGNVSVPSKQIHKKIHPICQNEPTLLISKRELQILGFVADGLSSRRIATLLGLSVNTINNHRKKMLNKNFCGNTSELISRSIKNGLM